MGVAGLVNAAMLIMAAATFHGSGPDRRRLDRGGAPDAGAAARAGRRAAIFAVSLLASGLPPRPSGRWPGRSSCRAFCTSQSRSGCAGWSPCAPSLVVIALGLDPTRTLVISQVVLSFGLPFARHPAGPLHAPAGPDGRAVNRRVTTAVASLVAAADHRAQRLSVFQLTRGRLTDDAHLLVPLDGSRSAEAALPVASALAARLGASVTLLHVLEHGAAATIHGDRHLHSAETAARYLAEVAASRFAAGVAVRTHVDTGRGRQRRGRPGRARQRAARRHARDVRPWPQRGERGALREPRAEVPRPGPGAGPDGASRPGRLL